MAPVCSSWTRISRGTSWRSSINPFGDLNKESVTQANLMISRHIRSGSTLWICLVWLTSTLEIIVFRFLHAQGGNPNAYQLGGARHLLVWAASRIYGRFSKPSPIGLGLQQGCSGSLPIIIGTLDKIWTCQCWHLMYWMGFHLYRFDKIYNIVYINVFRYLYIYII